MPIPPANYFNPRISPNGKQLAVNSDDGKDVAVWIYDLAGTNSMRRLTLEARTGFLSGRAMACVSYSSRIERRTSVCSGNGRMATGRLNV